MSAGVLDQLFADRLNTFGETPALICETGEIVTYSELVRRADVFSSSLTGRKKLLVIETLNCPEAIIAYIGALRAKHPLILAESGSTEIDGRITQTFSPHAVFRKGESGWGVEILNAETTPEMHPELAVLLSTSGSTGSPKLVRLSRGNIASNADAVANYLGIRRDDRAITSLPFHYSYGMSVINSHLAAGATLLLTNRSVVDEKFWQFFKQQSGTSFAAVGHTFELLERISFRQMDLPSLRYMTQAGGRLAPEVAKTYGQWANERGVRVFVMYGQTEAAPRMAFLPPEYLVDHPESIGRPLPGGAFRIVDDQGEEIREYDRVGELVYRGPNVMMGYAVGPGDLARGPELKELHTGDFASRNRAGFYKIEGRKNRFSKLLGVRISLDELEFFLAQRGVAATVAGDDAQIGIFVPPSTAAEHVVELIINRFSMPASSIVVITATELPRFSNGKINYEALLNETKREYEKRRDRSAKVSAHSKDTSTLKEAICWSLGRTHIGDGDSFLSLGGDSLSYVDVSLAIENHLGFLPSGWEKTALGELENLQPRPQSASGIDTDILLRAFAICGVIASHILKRSLTVPGGAFVLLMLAGYSLARFHRERLFSGTLRSVLSAYAINIFLPYYVLMLAMSVARRHLDVWQALFASTFYAHSDPIGIFWFMETLLYSLLAIGGLLAVPVVRRWASREPFAASIALLLIAECTRLVMHFDSARVESFSFPRAFVFFALGWSIFFAAARYEKLIVTGAAFAIAYQMDLFFPPHVDTRAWWILIATILVVWTKRLKIPHWLRAPVTSVALVSFYMYLLQIIPLHFLANAGPKWATLPAALLLTFALALGALQIVRSLKSLIRPRLESAALRLSVLE